MKFLDANGNPVQPGLYEVRRGGETRIGKVFEDDETTLHVHFEGAERPQRVDEISEFCTWEPTTQQAIDQRREP